MASERRKKYIEKKSFQFTFDRSARKITSRFERSEIEFLFPSLCRRILFSQKNFSDLARGSFDLSRFAKLKFAAVVDFMQFSAVRSALN